MIIFFKGANSYGQLGLDNVNDYLLPQKVTRFWEEGDLPKFVTGGGGHTAVITGEKFDFSTLTVPLLIEVTQSEIIKVIYIFDLYRSFFTIDSF